MQDDSDRDSTRFAARPGVHQPFPPVMPLEPARRSASMRRRIVVFVAAFGLAALISLSWVFMRPAIYLASARLQVTPAAKLETGTQPAPDATPALLAEMQVLTSRPLLELVTARLGGSPGDLGADPVATVQSMLEVSRVEGSNVLRIEATGPRREQVATVVNALLDTYREQQAATGQSSAQAALADARDEVRIVDARVAEKKRALEEFRLRANIVSGEREENRTLSKLKELGTAVSAAAEREAIAAGKVHALEQAVREGQRSPLAKDNPTVAALEQRLSQWREELRSLERQFTPQYLDMDPRARELRTRITNLEQQLDGERSKNQENALAAAREELSSAQATTRRLQQQLSEDKQSVNVFSRNFADYQAMQEELRALELMRTTARQRLIALEASEAARRPRTDVLEAAVTPQSAWRPLYARDAAIALAGSLVLGFLAVWFYEFFNRAEPVPAGPSTVIVPQPWVAIARPEGARLAAPDAPLPLPHGSLPALPGAEAPARELSDAELRRLLAEAAPQNLGAMLCLLCGLNVDEVAALQPSDLDASAGVLRVGGMAARTLALGRPLAQRLIGPDRPAVDGPLLAGRDGGRLSETELQATVISSALDAGLDEAQRIGPDTLRHTYVAYLVRQGLRFGDLPRLVAPPSAAELQALAVLAAGVPRVPLERIDPLLPAVRELAATT